MDKADDRKAKIYVTFRQSDSQELFKIIVISLNHQHKIEALENNVQTLQKEVAELRKHSFADFNESMEEIERELREPFKKILSKIGFPSLPKDGRKIQ